MAEPLGAQMASRSLEHMLQYGDPSVRRSVPLAIAMLNVSSPDMTAVDTLGRLSHDTDSEVAQNAVLALGLVGAGASQIIMGDIPTPDAVCIRVKELGVALNVLRP